MEYVTNFMTLLIVLFEMKIVYLYSFDSRKFSNQKVLLPLKPIATWRRIAGTRAAKKDCKYFPGGLFQTKLIL